jgi:hypothetical protein
VTFNEECPAQLWTDLKDFILSIEVPDDVVLKNGSMRIPHSARPCASSPSTGDANRYIDTPGVFDSDATVRKSAPTEWGITMRGAKPH